MSDENIKWNINFKTLKLPLIFIFIFYSIGIWKFISTKNTFYIYNFIYLGSALAIGIFLDQALVKRNTIWSRRITQLLIGIYMLGYLGFIRVENMQIEGFFYYLLSGVFAGATLHYFIAKIIGPLFFGRGWCSWACWTAMVLDFFPWKKSKGRIKNLEILKYLHFFLSLGVISFIWVILKNNNLFDDSTIELYWLIAGNSFYYIIGISLAFLLKDNRAFCKYICPIPVLQKLTSRFSLLKIEINKQDCINCYLCEKNCPMDIKLLKYKKESKRILSTECILCNRCINICPENAIEVTTGFDWTIKKEFLKYKDKIS